MWLQGTNITAPAMTTRIATENAEVPVKIYYSEKEDATKKIQMIVKMIGQKM